ncbi:hypothetical protein CAPTEDRAFT_212141 [Capitella teleta]|uniref:G-protein coupled receptors family 1 profile domain-containing protein n=1 Tax=Capitella teleta TaxID=283909 RepID=R7VG15_CAPTE|nr:hypothetical protein CAPTEDRAFT_212141 [Capitella teleta]|eukprot:ELU17783.1 hypothetical protein CAPTEDRAFT_212141 [Capitella teleta]
MKTLLFYLLFSALNGTFSAQQSPTTESQDPTAHNNASVLQPTLSPQQLFIRKLLGELQGVKRVEFVAVLVIGTLAVLGNLVVIMVTARYKSIGIPQVYMASLAVCDLCIGIFSLWRVLADRLFRLSDGVYWFCSRTYFPVVGLDVASSITAALVAMALSVDRCFALKFPMKHVELWSVRRAKVLVVVTGMVSLLFGLNVPLRLTITDVVDPLVNQLPPMYTRIGRIEAFTQACNYIEFLFRFAVPFAVMMVSNTWTMSIIRKSDKFRRGLDKDTRSAVNSPKCLTMTVGLVIIFFITQLPKAAFLFDTVIFFNKHRFTLAFETFAILSILFTKVNSIVNIFVYLALNKEFRRTLLQMLSCCCRQRNVKENSATETVSSQI